MEALLENIAGYAFGIALLAGLLFYYIRSHRRNTRENEEKIRKAKEFGQHEPVTLYPVVNQGMCIGSGACIEACPEKDILGLVNGKALTINTSRCVGHGACFHACPVQAITLHIGTERRGVELPHVSQEFETNVSGIFIAGELGGMGLIKNAVEQGRQAVENIAGKIAANHGAENDIIIVGAGPAGIAAALQAKKMNLRFTVLEQDTLGGTVFSFPRAKLVMTSPMELPLYGKIKKTETSKTQLLELWKSVLMEQQISIREQEKVEAITKGNGVFTLTTPLAAYRSAAVLLAIGRRGSPRKLGVRGEEKEKVYYRLLEPEHIRNQGILVVGGGDSAVETAMLLADEQNTVTLSYRADSFSRLKPKNSENIAAYAAAGKVVVLFNSTVQEIRDFSVALSVKGATEPLIIENNLVYVLIGGELPTAFLEKAGIQITRKFGDAILSHDKKN